MDTSSPVKQLAPGPKTRVCYICGRQYGLHSYDIHVKQCKELWIAREEQKDPKERKKLPEDPALKLRSTTNTSENSHQDDSRQSNIDLDELNKIASDTFNNVALDTCAFCGRTFLPEKLVIHNRSCTVDNPARKVTDNVRKGNPPQVLDAKNEDRPSTSSNRKEAKVVTKVKHGKTDSAETDGEETPSLQLKDGVLVGHLGGPSGRQIRTTNQNKPESFTNKDDAIKYAVAKINSIEGAIGELVQSLDELRGIVQNLRSLD